MLVTQHGYGAEQADLLSRKAHSVHEDVKEIISQPFISVRLADDLIVKTRLVINSSIQSVKARAVVIHKSGEIKAEGGYFLLECDSIQGEGLWWQWLQELDPNRPVPRRT